MNLVLIGAPGSGKGTQSKFLVEKFGFIQLSTGDLLRSAASQKTEIGLQAKAFMDKGALVPDDVLIGIVSEYLVGLKGINNVIFDGFPRTVFQAKQLEGILETRDQKIDSVIYFKVSENAVISRLTGRRTCANCGAIFHVESMPSKRGDECDKCGGLLLQRPDDKREVIENRLKEYEKNTGPTIEHFRSNSSFCEIDASADSDSVLLNILKFLDLKIKPRQ